MSSRYVLVACIFLALLLAIGATLRIRKPSIRPVRLDNYHDLRAKYVERLEREKRERGAREQKENGGAEDQFEIEFMRWDRYWMDHLDPTSREPGKMADMARYMHDYLVAAQRPGGVGQAPQATSLICPSAGLGNWTSMGPSTYAAPIMGKVTSVHIDPNNLNTAYAGSAHGGLFKTVNNGSFWTNLTDHSHYPSLGITSIAVHPTIPTTVYAGTNNGGPGYDVALGGPYGFGILKTTDGGSTWQETLPLATLMAVGEGAFVSKVKLHPQDPNTVYALALHSVFRSTNAGVTWDEVLKIVPGGNPSDGCRYNLIDIDIISGSTGVADSKVFVSTVRSGYQGGVNSPCGTAKAFISTIGGALSGPISSFSEITSAVLGGAITERIAGAVQPGNSADFFIGYADLITQEFVLKKYNIASQLAVQVGGVATNGVFELGTDFWCLQLQFSDLNANTVYVAGTTLYRINLTNPTAGGIQMSSYYATNPFTCAPEAKTHADIRAMTITHNGPKDVVVLGSDGGIHKAEFDPATLYTPVAAKALWHDMTGPGLALNEFFDISGMQSKPDLLVGGTLDNGTLEYYNGVWTQRYHGDGWHGTIDQGPSSFYTGQYYGMSNVHDRPLYGMTGIPGTFTEDTLDPAVGPFGPVVSDPNNPDVVYSGGGLLYKSWNGGILGSGVYTLPGTRNVRAIHVAPSDSNRLYVSRDGATWNPNDLKDHLFKSINAGGAWSDIGELKLPPLERASVIAIAVDPDDANRVWVSFNGYWATSNTSLNGDSRVWYSSDGGNTWTDFTYNMLAFPVFCLVYQRGSDDILYAGTDVGVFRYNKALQLWECFSMQLPVVSVTNLEINYCKNKIRAATFGRGIYESDLPALPSEVVNTSVTWSGQRFLSNDLTITSGATLTLTGTLYMSKDTVISVQRGATLDVNGGKITNACGDIWHGIEVWGTASAPQNLAGAQGKVIVQNGAKIENAEEAIITGRNVNNSFDWSYTGGIVQASNSFFYNNRRSVGFISYHWMNGTNELNNLSNFKNCTFETNRLLNEPTLLPYAHISLDDVKNVAILGCKFNNTTSTAIFGVNNRGDGVVSSGASYVVDGIFNTTIFPAVLIAPSVFNGLTYGVRADFTAGVNKKITIANSSFNNVQRGVQVDFSNGSSIHTNNFNALPNALTTNPADATWGVRLNNASALSVRDNTVTGGSAAYQNTYGVIIDNCGVAAGNLVRGNTLKNLYTGIQAIGGNGSGGQGVQFRCNVFQSAMAYQLAVQPGGTLANQGGACAPGNTANNSFFAQAAPIGSQINSPSVPFIYYASGTVPTNISGPVSITSCSNVSGECAGGQPQ
jgi:hypothetical protein